MKRVIIREPWWQDRSVSIADYHFKYSDTILVEISYRTKDGNKMFPGAYVLPKSKFLTLQKFMIKDDMAGRKLYLADLAELERVV